MRYELRSGIEIRTENAAKPASQPSKFLLKILADLPPVSSAFDYGCGKLRYMAAMAQNTELLALVDSEIQLSRTQILCGEKTSIRSKIKNSNHITTYNNVEFSGFLSQYNRGFCINVLSVIPSYVQRYAVLKEIHSKLRPDGECLFVVQYRNSDFSRMRRMQNAKPWRDGFLIESLRGYSFYGLISPDRLTRFLTRSGFAVRNTALNNGSAYVWAGHG